MTQPTRIYKHSSAGTDWAALLLGAGLGLALATALMVSGEEGVKYFSQPELDGYKPFVIGRHENTGWSI